MCAIWAVNFSGVTAPFLTRRASLAALPSNSVTTGIRAAIGSFSESELIISERSAKRPSVSASGTLSSPVRVGAG